MFNVGITNKEINKELINYFENSSFNGPNVNYNIDYSFPVAMW